ncbi:helix-turn-helix domain-containing protein [Sphingomonas baiyangensis]|uniref:Helix-turn-helix domain-containing protein n=1 Tax=Sphingomonas baiyangensis TaxID=2572576 RepID=A0A4V6WRE9_9SPHN|nr:helix-turn-helix transcriptional regulator [Sphingomonas baiyangensis]TKD50328.1 helix-turn-helix domain-containing protein [Sphingomonas baiyangensis]
MGEGKLIAGHAVRRVRRQAGLTQAAMAEALGISPSYLNLVERNQRPISATLLVRLAERFDFDARALAAGEPGGGAAALRRRLADPMFTDLEIDRAEIDEWLAAAPGGAEAFARVFDARGDVATSGESVHYDAIAREVRGAIEHWRNHFADLDAAAEALADELRLGSGDLAQAIAERLRTRHQLSVRILPAEVMPDALKRLDLHARQLQLSEMLDAASRSFAMAERLAVEAGGEIDALVRGAALADRTAERLFRRHLTGYFAAALMMPYARFLRACEATGYDIELLQRRFGAGFEQVAHRLTTLQRVGARGLPFFMLRVDRAGQVSKRYAGASASPLVEGGLCPLWDLFEAFARPGDLMVQLVEHEDTSRWLTMARTVQPQGARAGGVRGRFAIGLGVAASEAASLAAARGIDLYGRAVPIGAGCRACTRPACPQRSAAPAGRARIVSDREAGVTPFAFAGD